MKVRILLKAKKDFGTYKVGDTMTLYNEVFDPNIGIAFFPIEKEKWEVVRYDLFTGIKDKHRKEIYTSDIIKDLLNEIVYGVHWSENGLRFGKTVLIGSRKGQKTSLSDFYNDVSKSPDICENIEIIGDVSTQI